MSELFNTLNAIFYKRSEYEYKKKDANAYGLVLWLSHDVNLCGMVNEYNPYLFYIPDELTYKYLYEKVPKGKRFIKWVKKDSKKEEDLKDLAKKYNCSVEEIKKSVIME